MANITELIKNIRNAIYGKEVRESIAAAIEQTYEDATEQGNANMEVADARGNYSTLKKRLDNSDSVKADKTTTENLQKQMAVNSARIDNLGTLEEGSTTGDAELNDVRVGYNSTQYKNAGSAVRNQIDNIYNNLKAEPYNLKNLQFINRTTNSDNSAIDYTTIRNDRLINENIMYFKDSDEVVFSLLDTDNLQFNILQYDNNGNFISNTNWRTTKTNFTQGIKEKGFRILMKKQDNSNITNDDLVNLQIEIIPSKITKLSPFNFSEKMKANSIFEFNKDIMVKSGNINANGSIALHSHRYYTPHFYYFEKDTILKANDGFRIGCHYYPNFEAELTPRTKSTYNRWYTKFNIAK